MLAASPQSALFEPAQDLPHGLVYLPDFITAEEEAALLVEFSRLPFNEARFQQYTARRRVVRFGEGEYPASYGPHLEAVNPRRPFPDLLVPLRRCVANWRGTAEAAFPHALITEYRPGTPIGWHSDAPHFDSVVGISLAGAARMRFRPYAITETRARRAATIELALAPRSAYVMEGEIRWHWQHHIPPTRDLRYSITFRTLRDGAGRAPLPRSPALAEH